MSRVLAIVAAAGAVTLLATTSDAWAAKSRSCSSANVAGRQIRHLTATGLPSSASCALIQRVPIAFVRRIRHFNESKDIVVTALFQDWDCVSNAIAYASDGAQAVDAECDAMVPTNGGERSTRKQRINFQIWNV